METMDSLLPTVDISQESDFSLDSTWQTMGIHPKYLESFMAVHQYLLHGDGPLHANVRHYIAIMASARHHCHPLVASHINDMIRLRGHHEAWLLGLNRASAKIRAINVINKILAHRPWMITKQHFQELNHVADGENWSMSEIVQAIVLLTHFHAFTSFVLGCGVHEDGEDEDKDEQKDEEFIDPAFVRSSRRDNLRDLSCSTTDSLAEEEVEEEEEVPSETDEDVSTILSRMKAISEQNEELEINEVVRRFEKVEEPNHIPENVVRTGSSPSADSTAAPSGKTPARYEYTQRFTADLEFKYVDFVKRPNMQLYPTFRNEEFNWDEEGYSTIMQFYNEDIAGMLDLKYKTITNLTYFRIGKYQSVDTSMFRRAVRHYIECLYGIRHDDYNYGEVNELLPRPLKKYIKTVACFPEDCRASEYKNIMKDFLHSEKVHVCLLVSEAKFQATLLYALRALCDFYH